MDVEKNSTSSVDREENEFYSFGGTETQKLLEAAYPPIKAMLFWPRYESGAGHYACTSRRIQEAGKTMDAMA